MLTRVRIQNFRAIEDLSLELKPFQVLIGENNSGKTSFLDALVALQRVIEQGPQEAWAGDRFKFWRNLRASDAGLIRWEVENNQGARYALGIGSHPVGMGLVEESLQIAQGSFVRGWKEGGWVYQTSPGVQDAGQDRLQLKSARGAGLALLAELLDIRRYLFDPRVMVRPALPTASLEDDGAGFPGFLDRLQNNAPEVFETLQQHVRELFPRVRFVRAPALENGQRELAIVEKDSSQLIYGSQLSDGLLLLIGYLAITLSPEPEEAPSVLMLDEPEMGLHMDRADFLVDLLRDLSKGRFGPPVQVIITTHSPDIVDFLKPEELVVFERDEKGMRAQRLEDVKDIKKRLRGYNLGEYWSSFGEGGLLRGEEK